MSERVRVMTRRRARAVGKREPTEVVILRDKQVIAVLPEGDPLRYLLQLSPDQLLSMRENLAPVLKNRPYAKEVLEAIIEYKGGIAA